MGERGDYLFILPGRLLFKLNHCDAPEHCCVCRQGGTTAARYWCQPSHIQMCHSRVKRSGGDALFHSRLPVQQAAHSKLECTLTTHSVGLFTFLKLSIYLRSDSLILSLWGCRCCSGLHSFWTLKCSLLCKLMMLNSAVQATSLE